LLIKMRKQDLFAQGLVYDEETEQTIHNVRVTIRNDSTGEEESIVTRTDGFYRFAIEPGNSYTILAKRERFIPDSLQINTLSISKGVILNDFVIEEEFIDKEVILFDYDEYVLQPGAGSILQKTIDVLKKYPNDYVIIGAHADARGTFEYNLELSEKRANTVVEYLVERGISRNQIIARGFGEGLIINRCVDGVNCREEDHSLNRRAEIKVEEDPPEEEFYDRDQR
ncbi:MAG: OmpA family protein, partial [Bacteroidetes bacterium]|nr:OmpA family protein [Bacteroidota bacterium]